MTSLDILLPRSTVTQISLWGEVTGVAPLRVRLDGDPGPLPIDTKTLVAGLRVGDWVWCELITNSDPERRSRRLIVVGRNGGVNPHPVGAVYVSTDSTDPADLFGGTWAQITDVFLLAAGSTYTAGGTGGEAEHTLTVAELPAHHHPLTFVSGTGSLGIIPLGASGTNFAGQTGDTGSGDPHNNMPPYLVVYVWKRTA